MKLASPIFENGGNILSKYTCDGQNINPPLSINEVPPEAKSLALIMEDPDVPRQIRRDGMWDHWVVFDMPAAANTEIKEGQEPQGTHGRGTNGEMNYFGPCPPDREHRYFFKLFALDTRLNLSEGASKNEVFSAMKGHIIAQAELMGRYQRV
jgi:Raf kinase inhibitor-like YbhB/YbcL family protein